MRLLFPGIPYDRQKVDTAYQAEADAALAAGQAISTFSLEELERGKLRIHPPFAELGTVDCRGTGLSPELYERLVALVRARGGQLLAPPKS